MVKLLRAGELHPECELFLGPELEVAHFFLFAGLDLDINLVLALLNQLVITFEVALELLFKVEQKVLQYSE